MRQVLDNVQIVNFTPLFDRPGPSTKLAHYDIVITLGENNVRLQRALWSNSQSGVLVTDRWVVKVTDAEGNETIQRNTSCNWAFAKAEADAAWWLYQAAVKARDADTVKATS